MNSGWEWVGGAPFSVSVQAPNKKVLAESRVNRAYKSWASTGVTPNSHSAASFGAGDLNVKTESNVAEKRASLDDSG